MIGRGIDYQYCEPWRVRLIFAGTGTSPLSEVRATGAWPRPAESSRGRSNLTDMLARL